MKRTINFPPLRKSSVRCPTTKQPTRRRSLTPLAPYPKPIPVHANPQPKPPRHRQPTTDPDHQSQNRRKQQGERNPHADSDQRPLQQQPPSPPALRATALLRFARQRIHHFPFRFLFLAHPAFSPETTPDVKPRYQSPRAKSGAGPSPNPVAKPRQGGSSRRHLAFSLNICGFLTMCPVNPSLKNCQIGQRDLAVFVSNLIWLQNESTAPPRWARP